VLQFRSLKGLVGVPHASRDCPCANLLQGARSGDPCNKMVSGSRGGCRRRRTEPHA
jgi:hypothetical protein